MSCAIEAAPTGIKDILVVERGERLGGILPQCIHDGFGVIEVGASLSGPEFKIDLLRFARGAVIEICLEHEYY